MRVEVLVPVLDRPHRIAPFGASLRASVTDRVRNDSDVVRALFLCTEGDEAELAELRARGVPHLVLPAPREPGDYARKINLGVAHRPSADWYFLAADDLAFRPGWLDACLAVHEETGALVIGTQDLGNPLVKLGMHSTHTLVHRDYLAFGTVDEPGLLLHEGYDHNCVDVEFIETAIWRGAFAFAPDAHVEHLHPLWRKGPTDATYALGHAGLLADMALLRKRWDLWHHREVRVTIQRSRRVVLANGRREIRRR